jgi:hypothetical protein
MADRKPIRKKLRFDVFKRDGFVCQYCGAHPPDAILHCDHIVAVAVGGKDEIDNLVTACSACNLGKGAHDLNVVPTSLRDKAREVQEREEQLLAYQAVMQGRRDRLDSEAWRILEVMQPGVQSVSKDWFQSVKRFIERLGYPEVLDAADIASAYCISLDGRFRYFCGVCWNKVRGT